MIYDTCDLLDDFNPFINDVEIDDNDKKRLWLEYHKQITHERDNLIICPYCNNSFFKYKNEKQIYDHYEHRAKVWYCKNCGFWQFYWFYWNHNHIASGFWDHMTKPKLSEYSDNLPPEFTFEFAHELRKSPDLWHSLNTTKFEKLIGEIFKYNFKHCEIKHVGKSLDGGIDLYFVESDGTKWIIQVKRRTKPQSSEGVSAVRNLLGAMVDDQTLKGIFVSSSNHFSIHSKKFAERNSNRGYIINLVDRGLLNRMLNPILEQTIKMFLSKSEFLKELKEAHSSVISEIEYYLEKHFEKGLSSEVLKYR